MSTTSNLHTESVRVSAHDALRQGELSVPRDPIGVVLFAHGSGSSRRSPRNQSVATALHERGLATLLFDLLTEDEVNIDNVSRRLRFDIPFLSGRLIEATEWIGTHAIVASLALGYFGASTGAAAALVAAAQLPDQVGAIVSRGGRPDLAMPVLHDVLAPTLLIVGGADSEVIPLNERAFHRLRSPKELVLVNGATHLFEEPGTMDEVARLAGDWFERYLGGQKVNRV